MRKLKNLLTHLLIASVIIGIILGISYLSQKAIHLFYEYATASQETEIRSLTPLETYKIELYTQLNFNYKNYRLLTRVIKCESNWNEMAYNAKSNDYGLFQINYKTWNNTAIKLGYENYTDYWYDNISLGVWIFKNSGIQNWQWSSRCWRQI
jgi:hypothetical protein